MKATKPEFIRRCKANTEFMSTMPAGSKPDKIIDDLWTNIEATGSYSFNEAHAVAYAMIACWCAYMKCNYPEEFLTALLRTDPEKIPMYVRAIRSQGFNILPPDINKSSDKFTLSDEGIRFGITAVQSVGAAAFKEIDKWRSFKSLEEYMSKTSRRGCNSRVTSNLIKVGAFDSMGQRGDLLATLNTYLKPQDQIAIPDFNKEETIQEIEFDLLGCYLASDPMDKYTNIINAECASHPEEMAELQFHHYINIGGRISRVHEHTTKRGDPMAWITIEWNNHEFEVVVFPRAFAGYKYFIEEGKPVVCRVQKLERGCHLIELVRLDKQ
jgi:DNA polymerase-3 subunit alpha